MNSKSFLEQLVDQIAFPFRDRSWGRKLAIGSLLSLGNFIIPVVPMLFVYGYIYRIMRQVIAGETPALPEWDDWGKLLSDGAKLWGASLVYTLPIMLLTMVMLGGFLVPWGIFMFNLPTLESSALPSDMFGLLLGGFGLAFAALCLMMPLSLAVRFLLLPALGHMAATDRFEAAFEVGAWWKVLRSGFGGYLIVILATMLLSYAGMAVIQIFNMTIVLVVIYPFTMAVYMFLFLLYDYAFAATAYREGRRKQVLAE
jgi:hypothetical protein